jgi:di/tricarboxylate transporter
VSLVFPLVYDKSLELGIPLKTMMYVLMMGGSACFSTPIGYQTNMMVLASGGYNFNDFLRTGVPMTFFCGITSLGICMWHFGVEEGGGSSSAE